MTNEEKKQILEIDKIIEEVINLRKKNNWFELTIGITVFAIGIAFAKLFL